jgi:hypothetical protein
VVNGLAQQLNGWLGTILLHLQTRMANIQSVWFGSLRVLLHTVAHSLLQQHCG